MNRFICCLFLLGLNAAAFSQKQYFVYIQAETPQPFFVKINEKVYGSDGSGFLILSKLKDTSYTFKIGFPQNKWPEQQFLLNIRSKDRGFLLKQFDGKGWGLFDLQSLSVTMADEITKDKAAGSNGEISAFTQILSRAANDPSLLEKPVALVKHEEKPVIVQPAVLTETSTPKYRPADNSTALSDQQAKKDSSLSVKRELVKNEDTAKIADQQKKTDQPLTKNTGEAKKKTDTAAIVEQSTKKEEAVVADNSLAKNEDTVKIGDQQKKTEQPLAKNTGEIKKKTDTTAIVEQSIKKDEAVVTDKSSGKNKMADPVAGTVADYKRSVVTKRSESSTTEGLGLVFIDEFAIGIRDTVQIFIPNQTGFISKVNDQPAEQQKFLNVPGEQKDVSLIGSPAANKKNCLSIASDNDFMKLRKKMAAQRTDQGMISECRKVFKTKCFTTEQVKNLGHLFLNEAGKFQFYETAYPFNSDRDNFASLQMELKDAYFIHRFKKMVN